MKNIDSVGRSGGQKAPIVNIFPQKTSASGSVNLLTAKQKPKGKKALKRTLLAIVVVIVILAALVVARADNLTQKIFVGQQTTFFGKIVDLIRGGGDNATLTGQNLGQVNILLLGIGGEGHDGPYLTDTMILAQIRPDINQITLTSIPRDYWTQMPDGDYQKINAAFSEGYLKNHDWNQAGQYAIQVAQNLSGLTIPYFAEIDFSGFTEALDSVGGVDVTVDRTFTDYAYPDSGTGYLPPQTFTTGPQHMDGARALIFARSRHAAGIEGSDFARSQRQQKIIQAFEQKVLSTNLIKDASTINNLLGIVADHFHTNLTPGQLYNLYTLQSSKSMTILSLSLDPSTGLICQEIMAGTGAYILTPCPDKSSEDVQNFFKNSFAIGKLTDEKSVVWLASSTGNTTAYDTAYRTLTDAGITVYNLSYSKDQLPQTTVYQVNPKPATAEFIDNELGGVAATLPPPGVTVDPAKVDVIVVLGQNAPVEAAPPLYVAPPAATPVPPAASTTTSATSTAAQPTEPQ